jgi:hypothetical protein
VRFDAGAVQPYAAFVVGGLQEALTVGIEAPLR